ncbi:MAG TPA: hypothetical protein VMY37_05550 [Thermoguttaceae bacterium]|nr:hypothetical protein [Thermoguttaceae bacterium]
MRAEERHKMHQNELSEWLAKWLPQIKPYSNAMLLGVLLVVLAVLATIWWGRQSADETSLAWDGFYLALSGGDPANLEEIAALNPRTDVAHWAEVMAGDVHLANGCQQLFTDKSSAGDALRKAVGRYGAVLNVTPNWGDAWDLLLRKFAAMPRLAKLATTAVLLLLLLGACVLPFSLGAYLARKRGMPGSGWKMGLIPFALIVLVMIAACLGLPQILHAMGIDTTPPHLAMLHERATFGLARAYEALAGTRQSQGELDKAIESYEELIAKWPNGMYREPATRRLEELRQQETKSLYDKFAQFDPKPALPDLPGLPGEKPPFSLDSLPEEGSLPGLRESPVPDGAEEPAATTEDALPPAEDGMSTPADSDATAPQEPSGPEMPSAQSPAEPEDAPGQDQTKPELKPADSAPAQESSDQEPAAAEKPSAPGPTGSNDPAGAK